MIRKSFCYLCFVKSNDSLYRMLDENRQTKYINTFGERVVEYTQTLKRKERR